MIQHDRARSVAIALVGFAVFATACGSRSSATSADAGVTSDAPPPPPPDASSGDAGVPIDAPPVDPPADAPAIPVDPPTITSVQLDGVPDRQIRQGGQGTLAIEGTGLDHLASIRLGDLTLAIPSPTSPTSLRLAIAIPHGHAAGALDLAIANPSGAASAAGAVEVTAIVVAPDGSDQNRGTFASPLQLCRPSWDLALADDTVLLRDGIHACNRRLDIAQGVHVTGESRTGTIVRGITATGERFGGFLALTTFRGTTEIANLTIENAPEAIKVGLRGFLSVTSVDIRDSDVGITVQRGSASIDHVSFTKASVGAGPSLQILDDGVLDAAQATLSARIDVRGTGTLNIADSDITASGFGIFIDRNRAATRPTITLDRTRLRAGFTGISSQSADLAIHSSKIEARTDGLGGIGFGIDQVDGSVTVADSSITGFENGGINFVADRDPVDLAILRSELTGSLLGVSVAFGPIRFTMRDTHVHSALTALSLFADFTLLDLGTASAPGNNSLDTDSGGLALEDTRPTAALAIDAHGTTLNGQTFTGDILGPANLADAYSVTGPNTIHF